MMEVLTHLMPPFGLDVFCRKILIPFLIFKLLGSVLQNYCAPGNLSNLSFLISAEQLICRTPLLAASVFQAFSLEYF